MGFTDQEVAPLKFAVISKSATGDLVDAVAGKKIRVLGYALVCDAALTINFESGTTDISGAQAIAINGGVSYAGGADCPAFETAEGTKLALTISGSGNVRGHLTYVLI